MTELLHRDLACRIIGVYYALWNKVGNRPQDQYGVHVIGHSDHSMSRPPPARKKHQDGMALSGSRPTIIFLREMQSLSV